MTPKSIVDRLEIVIGAEGAPQRLVSAIELELVGYFGLASIQAAERAEKVTSAVARIISNRAIEADKLGMVASLTIYGAMSDTVAGCSYVLPADTTEVIVAKQSRLQADTLLAAIRALSFSEFERFGARVLKEIGATNVHITRHGGDQGIDFFGHLSLGAITGAPAQFMRLAHDVVLSFAGQAKHYPNSSLGPDVVRELVGAVTLARTKTFSDPETDIFEELPLKPFSPLVTLLFTTGRITKGARLLAEQSGIIARSGEQLAVFLADKGVGMDRKGTGSVFDAKLFSYWLNAN